MNKSTSFLHFHNSKATTLDVILHGGSKGIESPFIQKIFEDSKNKGNSVITFNFSYLERGEENSSGPELKEELETLINILNLAQYKIFSRVRLIGKSLGGIVASYFLNSLIDEERKNYEIIILGYVTGEIKLNKFEGKITIIQGQKDKFGGINIVKKDMSNAISQSILYLEIPEADHSYRDTKTKEPIHEKEALNILNSLQ